MLWIAVALLVGLLLPDFFDWLDRKMAAVPAPDKPVHALDAPVPAPDVLYEDDELGQVTREEVLMSRHLLQEVFSAEAQGTIVSNLMSPDAKAIDYITQLARYVMDNPTWDGRPVRFSSRVVGENATLTLIVSASPKEESPTPPTPTPPEPTPPPPTQPSLVPPTPVPSFIDRRWMSTKLYRNAILFWWSGEVYTLWRDGRPVGENERGDWEVIRDEAKADGYDSAFTWLENNLDLGDTITQEYREYGQVLPVATGRWIQSPLGSVFWLTADGRWTQVV